MVSKAHVGREIISIVLSITLILFFSPWAKKNAFADESSDRRNQLEEQLRHLENEAVTLDKDLQTVHDEGHTLAGEIAALKIEVRKRENEIERLSIAINKADIEIKEKSARVAELSNKIDSSKKGLATSLVLLYGYDQEALLTMLLKHANLSDFFGMMQSLGKVQATIQLTLGKFKENRVLVQREKDTLQEFEKDQQELKGLQEVERRFLAQKKREKDEILRLTKGKEDLFQKLLQVKKKNIASLRTQLFYLEKTGVTAEEAIRYADLAANRAGIRTSFLLALLEVETGKQFEDGLISVGTNVGTGNWKKDLYECYIKLGKPGSAEAERKAFFDINTRLGFDPDKMPVSRKPNYGCGGAMGSAQFLPTTWLRFESRVATLTSHTPPSPWNVEDAFTAAAIFLADAGAVSKTKAGEITAAKTYISGQPNCARYICRSYADRIVSLARDIDRIL